MRKLPTAKSRPVPAKRRRKVVTVLRQKGALFAADAPELVRRQKDMLNRFEALGVPKKRLADLRRCSPTRCGRKNCSAVCWFAERAYANRLTLDAVRVLKAGVGHLWFVTVIDLNRARPAGDLAGFDPSTIAQTLRRALRDHRDVLGDVVAFAYVEVALETLRNDEEVWCPHLHMVMRTSASAAAVRNALRPKRVPPEEMRGGRERVKPIVVKPARDLPYLLDYMAKRQPEHNLNGFDAQGRHRRVPRRLSAERCLEHDLWLLELKPGARIVLRGLKRTHDRLKLLPRA